MRLYLIAMQFLTIIPIPVDTRCTKEDLGSSTAAFPLVGLTIGGLLAAVNWLLSPYLARPVVDALLITTLAAVTGGLHLDGLADVCDGLAARGGRERFLAVMKDSHVGAVGAVGLVLGLLLKWQALVAIPDPIRWQALLLFPLLARFGQVQTIVFARAARQDGLGSAFSGGAGTLQLVIAAIMTLTATWLLLGLTGLALFAVTLLCTWSLKSWSHNRLGGITGLALLAVTLLCTWSLKSWFHHRLGGITGDVIGCINEINEILVLLVLSALPQLLNLQR